MESPRANSSLSAPLPRVSPLGTCLCLPLLLLRSPCRSPAAAPCRPFQPKHSHPGPSLGPQPRESRSEAQPGSGDPLWLKVRAWGWEDRPAQEWTPLWRECPPQGDVWSGGAVGPSCLPVRPFSNGGGIWGLGLRRACHTPWHWLRTSLVNQEGSVGPLLPGL